MNLGDNMELKNKVDIREDTDENAPRCYYPISQVIEINVKGIRKKKRNSY